MILYSELLVIKSSYGNEIFEFRDPESEQLNEIFVVEEAAQIGP